MLRSWPDWSGWGTTTGIKLSLPPIGAKAEFTGGGPGVSAPGSKKISSYLYDLTSNDLQMTLKEVARMGLVCVFHFHQYNHRVAGPSINMLS